MYLPDTYPKSVVVLKRNKFHIPESVLLRYLSAVLCIM